MRVVLLRLLRRVVLRLSRRSDVWGIPIYIDPSVESVDAIVAKVGEAVALIRNVDARRWNRLRSDLASIVVDRLGRRGAEFDSLVFACVIDADYVASAEVFKLARSIVHEGTHARIWRRGIGYPPALRSRIERRCLLEEAAFAEAAGFPLPPTFLEKLNESWFTEERLASNGLKKLEANNAPRWLIRFLQWYLRRRQAAGRSIEAV